MSNNKDLVQMVLAILDGSASEKQQEEFYKVIQAIAAKFVFRRFESFNGETVGLNEITRDVTQEFFAWLSAEDKKKGFSQRKHRLTNGYLLKKLNNIVFDYWKREVTRNKYVPASADTPVYTSEEDDELTLLDVAPSEDELLKLADLKPVALDFVNLLERKLNDENLKTLCHLIFREKYSADCFLEGLSSAAKYKRVERIKKTLRELLKENPLTEEEWKVFVNLMEDYCQNRFGKCV